MQNKLLILLLCWERYFLGHKHKTKQLIMLEATKEKEEAKKPTEDVEEEAKAARYREGFTCLEGQGMGVHQLQNQSWSSLKVAAPTHYWMQKPPKGVALNSSPRPHKSVGEWRQPKSDKPTQDTKDKLKDAT